MCEKDEGCKENLETIQKIIDQAAKKVAHTPKLGGDKAVKRTLKKKKEYVKRHLRVAQK